MDTTRSYAPIWGGSKITMLAVITSRFDIPRSLHWTEMYSRCVLELETAVTRDLGYLTAWVGQRRGSGYRTYGRSPGCRVYNSEAEGEPQLRPSFQRISAVNPMTSTDTSP